MKKKFSAAIIIVILLFVNILNANAQKNEIIVNAGVYSNGRIEAGVDLLAPLKTNKDGAKSYLYYGAGANVSYKANAPRFGADLQFGYTLRKSTCFYGIARLQVENQKVTSEKTFVAKTPSETAEITVSSSQKKIKFAPTAGLGMKVNFSKFAACGLEGGYDALDKSGYGRFSLFFNF